MTTARPHPNATLAPSAGPRVAKSPRGSEGLVLAQGDAATPGQEHPSATVAPQGCSSPAGIEAAGDGDGDGGRGILPLSSLPSPSDNPIFEPGD